MTKRKDKVNGNWLHLSLLNYELRNILGSRFSSFVSRPRHQLETKYPRPQSTMATISYSSFAAAGIHAKKNSPPCLLLKIGRKCQGSRWRKPLKKAKRKENEKKRDWYVFFFHQHLQQYLWLLLTGMKCGNKSQQRWLPDRRNVTRERMTRRKD